MESILPGDTGKTTGRPGVVPGTIRLNCDFDYDRLVEIANEHKSVYSFLGHVDFDQHYALQRIEIFPDVAVLSLSVPTCIFQPA